MASYNSIRIPLWSAGQELFKNAVKSYFLLNRAWGYPYLAIRRRNVLAYGNFPAVIDDVQYTRRYKWIVKSSHVLGTWYDRIRQKTA